jgi:hypothetical protein
MKTETSLKSFEQIARSRGVGSLLIGGLLVVLWVGGHGALYGAYRVASANTPAAVSQVA